jgi:hypothetical protein
MRQTLAPIGRIYRFDDRIDGFVLVWVTGCFQVVSQHRPRIQTLGEAQIAKAGWIVDEEIADLTNDLFSKDRLLVSLSGW